MSHTTERDGDHIPFAPAALKLSILLLVCALWHRSGHYVAFRTVAKSSGFFLLIKRLLKVHSTFPIATL